MARLADIARPATADEAGDRAITRRIILIALAFKIFIALILPLGLDEAYAIAVARDYSLSFFDHPPLSFWLPVAMADLTGLEYGIIYRLPFLAAGVATTWIMFLIGREIGGARVGALTALLYAAAPFFLVSAGVLAVPDGTLNLFSALSVLALVRIARAGDKPQPGLWLLAGLGLAGALASKYQAAWIPVATLMFMLTSPVGRRWFLQPWPWIGVAVGLVGLLPVILWNMQHDWISFGFHTSRAGGGLRPANLVWMLFGQALFLLPMALWASIRGLWPALCDRTRAAPLLLALIALGPILMFNYVYFTSTRSHAHWAMPGWQFALPLAALWLSGRGEASLSRLLRWMRLLLVVIWAPLVVLVIHANTGILTRPFHEKAPDWDNTLSIFDFGELKAALADRGLWQDSDLFMASSWAFGGILDTFLGGEKPMRIADRNGAHHFVFLADDTATGQALYMEPALLKDRDATDQRILAAARKLDPGAELLPPIMLKRGGRDYVAVSLVRLVVND